MAEYDFSKLHSSAMAIEGQVVPFGKYRGQPFPVMMADQEYVAWLCAQPWFAERFAAIHAMVTGAGARPEDSPEHNQMQARFLDRSMCAKVAIELDDRFSDGGRQNALDQAQEWEWAHEDLARPGMWMMREPSVDDVSFEAGGWDVVFTAHSAWVRASGKCPDDHQISSSHNSYTCPWKDASFGFGVGTMPVRAELKPDLGDDYPSVLRQVKRYIQTPAARHYPPQLDVVPRIGPVCVIVRRAAFRSVTWEQVQAIFANSGVTLMAEPT